MTPAFWPAGRGPGTPAPGPERTFRVLARRAGYPRPGARARTCLAAVLGALVVGSGCAERQLVTRPEAQPSSATWAAVAIAAVLAAGVIGILLTLPAWRARTGARLAVAVLSAFTGAVVLGGAALVGTAVRSWQLVDRPIEAAAEPALVRLSAVDGDTGFFALMVLVTVVLTGLVATLLAIAARWAATDDRLGRILACVVLALLAIVGLGSAVMVAAGSSAWPYLTLTVATPLVVAALLSCRPPARSVVVGARNAC